MNSILQLLVIAALTSGQDDKRPAPVLPDDPGYSGALATADKFLEAWRMRKQADGIALCSADLKHKHSADELRSYMSGLSNPHHKAFEISGGKRLSPSKYQFQVRLYETYSGYPQADGKLPPQRPIVVIRSKAGTWSIDELP